MQEIQKQEIQLKIGEQIIPATRQVQLSKQHVPMEVIKELQLGINIPRANRRKLAKKKKMDWNVYQTLTREIHRRIYLRLNLETGKRKEIENETN